MRIFNLIVVFLLQRIFNSNSPLLARRYHDNIPWLAGIGLQSPFEARNAFSELLKGQGGATLGKRTSRAKVCPQAGGGKSSVIWVNPFLGPQKVNWDDLAKRPQYP